MAEENDKPKRTPKRKMIPKSRQGRKYNIVKDENGLSEWQKRDLEEFLKVREGESPEQWAKRTATRRQLTEEEYNKTTRGRKESRKIKVQVESRKKVHERYERTRVRTSLNVTFNPVKYYKPIITWATIKYDISRNDLELLFWFYDVPNFTKTEFFSKGLLFGYIYEFRIKHFLEKGYIKQIEGLKTVGKDKYPIDLYRLSLQMKQKIRIILDYITATKTFSDIQLSVLDKSDKYHIEVRSLLTKMNQDIRDIVTGKSMPDGIVPIKED